MRALIHNYQIVSMTKCSKFEVVSLDKYVILISTTTEKIL